MTPIDKALTGEWYEIKEARKALDSAAARLDGMHREREEYFRDRRRYRQALEFIRDNCGNPDAPDCDDVAREALRLQSPAFGCLRCFPTDDCPEDCLDRNHRVTDN